MFSAFSEVRLKVFALRNDILTSENAENAYMFSAFSEVRLTPQTIDGPDNMRCQHARLCFSSLVSISTPQCIFHEVRSEMRLGYIAF